MDHDRQGSEEPNESTYILAEKNNTQTKLNGNQIASQFPLFSVPEGSSEGEVPKLVPGVALSAQKSENDLLAEKSSLPLTSFNYINSIVGSGVIGMPYAMKESGFGIGLLLLLFVGIVTDYSLIILIEAAQISNVSTYQDLVRRCFGSPGFILQSIFQFLYPFISLISYNIIVGDTLTKVIIRLPGISPLSVVVRREFIIATVTLLITLPLSLYRNIARLAKVSLVSVIIIVGIVITMIYRAFTLHDDVEPTPDAWTFAKPNVASAIAIMCFAFMCHHSSFLVFDSLQDNTQPRWNTATHASVSSAAALSIVFAVAGFVTFTGYSQGDIFENYCWRDDLMNACRGLYAITILFTYPIECFVAREVIENLLFSDYQPQPFVRHAALTALIAVIGFLLSLTTDCLGIVLEVNGLLCAIPLAYILPPLCYIRVKEGPLFCREKYGAWAVAVGGSVVLLVGVVTIYVDYDKLSTCSHGKQMHYCFPNFNTSTA